MAPAQVVKQVAYSRPSLHSKHQLLEQLTFRESSRTDFYIECIIGHPPSGEKVNGYLCELPPDNIQLFIPSQPSQNSEIEQILVDEDQDIFIKGLIKIQAERNGLFVWDERQQSLQPIKL